jgi:hypothetical protein
VIGAAHEHVVDPSVQLKLPVQVLGRHQRILGREGVAWLVSLLRRKLVVLQTLLLGL